MATRPDRVPLARISAFQSIGYFSMRGAISEQLRTWTGGFKLIDQSCDPLWIRTGQHFPSNPRNLRKPGEFDQDDTRFPEQVGFPTNSAGVRQDLIGACRQANEIDIAHRLAELDARASEAINDAALLQA